MVSDITCSIKQDPVVQDVTTFTAYRMQGKGAQRQISAEEGVRRVLRMAVFDYPGAVMVKINRANGAIRLDIQHGEHKRPDRNSQVAGPLPLPRFPQHKTHVNVPHESSSSSAPLTCAVQLHSQTHDISTTDVTGEAAKDLINLKHAVRRSFTPLLLEKNGDYVDQRKLCWIP
ncbi:uncharacterized protein BYT42DRAFT_343534 [Radiomyces spectabilis]|uniref:uncharacterized protein n=1 Tax=Radiomyces spectabilis TaxID=64574 RepID=UPI00222031FF|nr:uncharacterized protein BYT42DRAFT_343534 [Radiomyces spectabilis]KAI8377409.1 hypothetical protein BYT42DRAFT_343534 [Radiomyces spectabilis]